MKTIENKAFEEICRKDLTVSEINRLKSLNQLGLLEKVFPGAHHTRWEYIVLQLFLLKKFKEDLPGRGFSPDIKGEFGFSFNFSAMEAIQMFILLQNYGHLNGTFETECLVLEVLSADSNVENRLISLLPEDFKEWGATIIKSEKKLEFFKVLSVFFVKHSKDFKTNKKLRDISLKILKGFYLRTSERLFHLSEKVKLIRDIAYIFLDLNYVAIGFNIALPTILLSAREFAKKTLDKDSRFYQFTKEIRGYLNESVYLSPEAVWCLLEARKKIGKRISSKLKKHAENKKLWVQYLEGLKRTESSFNVEKRPPFFVIQLPIRIFQGSPVIEIPITYIKSLCNKLDIDECSLSHIIPSSDTSQMTLYFFRSVEESTLAKNYYGLLSELCTNEEKTLQSLRGIRNLDKLFRFQLFQKSFDSVFKSFLYLLTDENYDIYIEPTQLRISSIISQSKTKSKKVFETLFSSDFVERLSKSQKNELNCIKYVLNEVTSRGRMGFCFSRISFNHRETFEGSERKQVEATEIDGIVLESNKSSTKFHIIEAKDQKSGSVSAAKKQLEEFKDKLKIHAQFKTLISEPKEIPSKGAFVTITFNLRKQAEQEVG